MAFKLHNLQCNTKVQKARKCKGFKLYKLYLDKLQVTTWYG